MTNLISINNNQEIRDYLVAYAKKCRDALKKAPEKLIPEIRYNGPSLCDQDLSYLDLRGVNLESVDLNGANLSFANLAGANLVMALLYDADLRMADLSSANLERTTLGDANLAGADLSWANLDHTDLDYANLQWANLYMAELTDIKLKKANTWGAIVIGTINNSNHSIIPRMETINELCMALKENKFLGKILEQDQFDSYRNFAISILNYDKVATENQATETKDANGFKEKDIAELRQYLNKHLGSFLAGIISKDKNNQNTSLKKFSENPIYDHNVIGEITGFLGATRKRSFLTKIIAEESMPIAKKNACTRVSEKMKNSCNIL